MKPYLVRMRNTIACFATSFAILFGQGCTASVGVETLVPGEKPTVAAHAVLHMDTDFTPSERAAADQAASIWAKQTSGLARIDLVYDLDFQSVQNVNQHFNDHDSMVVRRVGWMGAVQAADDDACTDDDPSTEADEHACVLGWMTSGGIHNPQHLPIYGAFVMDRLEGPDVPPNWMLAVMLHEFGHVLGLPHVSAVQAIMYPSVSKDRTNCLKKPDLVAFCQVNECGTTKLYPCE